MVCGFWGCWFGWFYEEILGLRFELKVGVTLLNKVKAGHLAKRGGRLFAPVSGNYKL